MALSLQHPMVNNELGCTVRQIVQATFNGQMHASTCVDVLSGSPKVHLTLKKG